jgi:predicted nucleic acid-binding protein
MPILLDTNIYLFAVRSEKGAAFFREHCLPQVFRTYLSGVVVEELYAGALTAVAVRLVERYVGALERAGRVVAPTFQDWKAAGKLVARITRTEPRSKPKIQELLNDILLAQIARRIGADLWTANREDFRLIRRHLPFSLRLLSWGEPVV